MMVTFTLEYALRFSEPGRPGLRFEQAFYFVAAVVWVQPIIPATGSYYSGQKQRRIDPGPIESKTPV
jgi:hypothetical protein